MNGGAVHHHPSSSGQHKFQDRDQLDVSGSDPDSLKDEHQSAEHGADNGADNQTHSESGQVNSVGGSDVGVDEVSDADPAPVSDWHQKYQDLLSEREQEQQAHLRFKADIENLKRRLQKDHHATSQYILEKLFGDLLPALDSFDRALDNQAENSQAILQGVNLVYKQLMGVLHKHGLERVECDPGAAFDPEIHQAVKIEHSPQVTTEQVMAVFQNGYKLHERLLRPAVVHVQAPAGESAAQREELEE